MKSLITGATGYVGGNLIKKMSELETIAIKPAL